MDNTTPSPKDAALNCNVQAVNCISMLKAASCVCEADQQLAIQEDSMKKVGKVQGVTLLDNAKRRASRTKWSGLFVGRWGYNNACHRVTAVPGMELRPAGQSAREALEGCFVLN